MMDGLRWVSRDRAVFYFVVDDAACRIDVLAVFLGGEDHKQRILERILSG